MPCFEILIQLRPLGKMLYSFLKVLDFYGKIKSAVKPFCLIRQFVQKNENHKNVMLYTLEALVSSVSTAAGVP